MAYKKPCNLCKTEIWLEKDQQTNKWKVFNDEKLSIPHNCSVRKSFPVKPKATITIKGKHGDIEVIATREYNPDEHTFKEMLDKMLNDLRS